MTWAWLAEMTELDDKDRAVIGVFSTPVLAMNACQDEAGPASTLAWQGNDEYCLAFWQDPEEGNWLLQVTRLPVDEKRTP